METKKVSWNASQGLIMEISNRRSMANSYFINRDIKKAFNTLISIKQSVIQLFNDKEREKLQTLEENFSKIEGGLSKSYSSSFDSSSRKVYTQSYLLAKKFYSTYNNALMDLLESRGYLIGEQSDSSSMKF